MPTLPSQILCHQLAETLLVSHSQPKVGLGMHQSLPTAVLHQLELPEVVLHLFQILLGVADTDFASPPVAHLGLEGSVPNPDHVIINFISKHMLKIE